MLHLLPVVFSSTDPAIERLLRFDGYHAIVYSNALFVIPIWLNVFAFVGLFFLQNWGRYLYLLAVASYAATSLIFGYRIDAPIESFLGQIASTLDGVILAIVFISPLKTQFATARP
jgi:hypothetical protein